MKKATAFLSLLGSLLVLFGTLYLVRFYPVPQDFTALEEAVKGLIKEDFRIPGIIGATVFWLATYLLSLMVLLEPDSGKNTIDAKDSSEKIEEKDSNIQKTPEEKPDNSEELARLEALLKDKSDEINSLEEQLKDSKKECDSLEEKLNAKADEKNCDSDELKGLESSIAKLKTETDELKSSLEKAEKEKTTLSDEASKCRSDLEAMIAKIEKSEAELKSSKKEADKAKSEAKKVSADVNKKLEEIEKLQNEVEELTKTLQDAKADAKSGKHGIPPAAYQILYLLQKEGRLIDLLMENIEDFDDETLGGAIRPIHEGCRKLLDERLIIEPVLSEEEGSEITIEEHDPEAIKLSGNVPAKGPYTGELVHRGWRLKECHLPELVDGWAGNVVAPAEIEIA